MQIVGVSFDQPSKNQAWAEDEGFAFELWSDLDRTLAMHYGAASSPTQGAASRVTKVLGADGQLLLEYSGVSVATHPTEVLSDCRLFFGD